MKRAAIGVHLATFAMVVFGCVETAFANPSYSFTTIDVPGAMTPTLTGSTTAARSWEVSAMGYMASCTRAATSPFSMALARLTPGTTEPTGSTTAVRSWESLASGGTLMAICIRAGASPPSMSPGLRIPCPGDQRQRPDRGIFRSLGGADTWLRVYGRQLHHDRWPRGF